MQNFFSAKLIENEVMVLLDSDSVVGDDVWAPIFDNIAVVYP